ncbi:MAG: hypothetical protein J6D18_00430, partial [Erysipelotrichaceae bacterium]|nr:hypothetical protein [Erysipelotrichaceae bacterium]
FDEWYDKEKKIAQQHPEDMNQNHKNWSDVGHYWNIKQSRYAYQGAAVNQKSTDYIRTFGNTFNYTAHKTSVTVDAFAKSVNSYYNNLMKDIDAYQDALKTQTTLKNNATVKNNEYTTANNKYAQTNNALNTAKNNLVQVNDQIARKKKELEETNAQILWLKDQIAQTNADRQSLETVDYIRALIECDSAEAQLNDAQNNRYEKQQSVAAAQQNVALQEYILAQMYGSVESAYQTLLKQEAQYVAKTEVLNEKTDELNSRQAKSVLAQSKVDASMEEIRGTESTIDGLNHQLSAYQQQLKQDEEQLAGLKQKRLTVSLLENDIEQLATRIVDLRMELNNTSSSQRSVMLHNLYVQISQVLRQA